MLNDNYDILMPSSLTLVPVAQLKIRPNWCSNGSAFNMQQDIIWTNVPIADVYPSPDLIVLNKLSSKLEIVLLRIIYSYQCI